MQRALILAWLALLAQVLPAISAPDEELLGKSAGYPLGTRANWFYDERVRVGSRRTNRSKTRARSCTGMPGPSSAIVMTA